MAFQQRFVGITGKRLTILSARIKIILKAKIAQDFLLTITTPEPIGKSE